MWGVTILNNLHSSSSWRRDNNAELFHHLKQFPRYITCGVQSNSNECLGWCMYVFHIRKSAGICMCELCGTKTTTPQRGVSARRESSDTGKTSVSAKLKSFVCDCPRLFWVRLIGGFVSTELLIEIRSWNVLWWKRMSCCYSCILPLFKNN